MLKTKSIGISSEKGFTLIELLISITVFLIAVTAIYGVMRIATIQKNTVSNRTDQLRSARISLEYIRRDVINAGFGYHRTGGNIPDNAANGLLGIPSDTDTERDLLTSIIAGNNISTNTLGSGGKMDVIGVISRDPSFALLNYSGATANGAAVDVAINTSTSPTGTDTCNLYDLYLLESATVGTTQVAGVVTNITTNSKTLQFASGTADPLKLNQPANGSGFGQSLLVTTPGGGTIKKINLVSYSITNDGVLVRKRFGNQTGKTVSEQVETRELVYGVSDFQIKYFMEDGTTIDDPSAGNNGRNNQILMNSVVQIQVSITLAGATDGQPQVSSPLVIKEYISTKNLRYEAS
jgi:prepilin-type N-terminal cleavage/methylation domain-containing protein